MTQRRRTPNQGQYTLNLLKWFDSCLPLAAEMGTWGGVAATCGHGAHTSIVGRRARGAFFRFQGPRFRPVIWGFVAAL